MHPCQTNMQRHYVLFDDFRWRNLLPLTFTRPVSGIRVGILTIREKWERFLKAKCSYLTADYLQEKYPLADHEGAVCYINGGVCPDTPLIERMAGMKPGSALATSGVLLVGVLSEPLPKGRVPGLSDFERVEALEPVPLMVTYPWDIFRHNGIALESDFEILTRGKQSEPIPVSNQVINPQRVFIENGARVECSTLNAATGPIYIGREAEIMEGSIIRGPFALCEHSAVKMGAKIYGPTTIGPHSKVGGEVNNCVIFGCSNKAHDGFLGNSVLGEWCNLGADSNNSNLKNNYAEVKIWNYDKKGFVGTGLQFCGLIMGDHSKCGINTMFNTGTVVGVSANIFGSGFPRTFIPSFAWGGPQGFTVYQLEKAFETARLVMARRGITFDAVEQRILTHVFHLTEEYRRF